MNNKLLSETEIVLACGGKGGVGKSTVAVNLATLLTQIDIRVGLLDADLQGPSIPTMLGLSDRPKVLQGKIQPLVVNKLKVMSTGLLASPEQTFAWKGPLLRGALKQLLRDVAWGNLDVMIIDTPPGTGELHMALVQLVDITGAIVVTTPQKVALADTRRCITMLQAIDIPIRAVVQNMSYFVCPHCDTRSSIFNNVRHGNDSLPIVSDLDVPIFELPILPAIAQHGDAGIPTVATHDGKDKSLLHTFAHLASRALSNRSSILMPTFLNEQRGGNGG